MSLALSSLWCHGTHGSEPDLWSVETLEIWPLRDLQLGSALWGFWVEVFDWECAFLALYSGWALCCWVVLHSQTLFLSVQASPAGLGHGKCPVMVLAASLKMGTINTLANAMGGGAV